MTPSATPIPSDTPTMTLTSTATTTPTPTITPTWIPRKKGEVVAPILLYHHIRDGQKPARYEVPVATFREQMVALKTWGYTSITVSQLVEVIKYGGSLPEKPVIITFDDGDVDVFQNAYPIMKELGFTGVFYIVSNRVGVADFVSVDQLKELISVGWEIGSHSNSHLDLVQNPSATGTEARGSKIKLQNLLGIPINTFAYPFGSMEPMIANSVASYGYSAAVGLGTFSRHTIGTIFYLSRLEVRAEYDMDAFAKLLPWSPLSTPSPSPTSQ
jgi:peptidoglycan/xylan/chitin deacetylase (PgdA/CDA1 family)